MEQRQISYAINGKWLKSSEEDAFLGEEEQQTTAQLFPFVSGWNAGAKIAINCGERPFEHPLWSVEGATETAFRGVAEYATGDLPVLAAAKQGHWSAVEAGLDSVIEKKQCDTIKDREDGRTLLWFASEGGALELVRRLVDAGANVGLIDDKGEAPLLAAAKRGHGEVVRVLIDEQGIELDTVVPGGDGKTALHLMAEHGDSETVQALLNKGSDVKATDKVCDECDEQ